jgi:hypothetical protein
MTLAKSYKENLELLPDRQKYMKHIMFLALDEPHSNTSHPIDSSDDDEELGDSLKADNSNSIPSDSNMDPVFDTIIANLHKDSHCAQAQINAEEKALQARTAIVLSEWTASLGTDAQPPDEGTAPCARVVAWDNHVQATLESSIHTDLASATNATILEVTRKFSSAADRPPGKPNVLPSRLGRIVAFSLHGTQEQTEHLAVNRNLVNSDALRKVFPTLVNAIFSGRPLGPNQETLSGHRKILLNFRTVAAMQAAKCTAMALYNQHRQGGSTEINYDTLWGLIPTAAPEDKAHGLKKAEVVDKISISGWPYSGDRDATRIAVREYVRASLGLKSFDTLFEQKVDVCEPDANNRCLVFIRTFGITNTDWVLQTLRRNPYCKHNSMTLKLVVQGTHHSFCSCEICGLSGHSTRNCKDLVIVLRCRTAIDIISLTPLIELAGARSHPESFIGESRYNEYPKLFAVLRFGSKAELLTGWRRLLPAWKDESFVRMYTTETPGVLCRLCGSSKAEHLDEVPAHRSENCPLLHPFAEASGSKRARGTAELISGSFDGQLAPAAGVLLCAQFSSLSITPPEMPSASQTYSTAFEPITNDRPDQPVKTTTLPARKLSFGNASITPTVTAPPTTIEPPSPNLTCLAPPCDDTVSNGYETDPEHVGTTKFGAITTPTSSRTTRKQAAKRPIRSDKKTPPSSKKSRSNRSRVCNHGSNQCNRGRCNHNCCAIKYATHHDDPPSQLQCREGTR